MRRLYVQIFLAFAGIAFLSMVTAGLTAWVVVRDGGEVPRPVVTTTRLLATNLQIDEGDLDASLQALGEQLELRLTLWDAHGNLLGNSHGEPLPWPAPDEGDSAWVRGRGVFGAAVRLEDGRWIGGSRLEPHRLLGHLAVLFALGVTIALGCLPLARRITRRVSRLDDNVKRLGRGDLSARVAIEGRDEVADLARSFNEAAERIQKLVEAQRGVLVSASHELRTPMTRLRLALELLAQQSADPAIIEGATRDIEELDALVGDLLLGARLEAGVASQREPVDLLALAREEAARLEAAVRGTAVVTEGERKLLQRLLRNLLENAVRHGGGLEVEVAVGERDGSPLLTVSDRGPGVAEDQRERIFEPFYRAAGHAEGRDGGVGVGLALVRQIAEHHGGTARCLPRDGGGSVFEVVLS